MMRLVLLLVALPILAFADAPECIRIVNARALLPTGFSDYVSIEIRGTTITSVTEGRPAGGRCTILDVGGKPVTPGLIDPSSQVGLVEISGEGSLRDHESGPGKLRASFSAADAYNPRSSLVALSRRAGITSAILVPTSGAVSGVSAWVDLYGSTQAETIMGRSVAMHAAISSGKKTSRAQAIHRLRLALLEARRLESNRGRWDEGRSRPLLFNYIELDALLPVLKREMPLAVQVDRASDIEAVLRLGAEFSLRLVIVGGAEAWLVAPLLAKAKAAVLLDPLVGGPRSFDQRSARPDNAALLHAAGVDVMMSAFWAHNARTLTQVAGNAVRAGLPYEAALQSLTSVPARVFGLKGRGTLTVGSRANLVVWTGDPLELSSHASQVFIGGVSRPLETRQTRLLERYRANPAAPVQMPPSP
ncbi:MAG: imidazolonepropionase-like amidohydrolase [Myxococcota bacterium]|jgi:imidazolonepropionase-like amidohydrolase